MHKSAKKYVKGMNKARGDYGKNGSKKPEENYGWDKASGDVGHDWKNPTKGRKTY